MRTDDGGEVRPSSNRAPKGCSPRGNARAERHERPASCPSTRSPSQAAGVHTCDLPPPKAPSAAPDSLLLNNPCNNALRHRRDSRLAHSLRRKERKRNPASDGGGINVQTDRLHLLPCSPSSSETPADAEGTVHGCDWQRPERTAQGIAPAASFLARSLQSIANGLEASQWRPALGASASFFSRLQLHVSDPSHVWQRFAPLRKRRRRTEREKNM